MPHEVRFLRAPGLARCLLAGALPVLGVLLLSGCGAAADLLNRGSPRNAEPQPVVDRAAASAAVISAYLEGLQRLVAAPAAEQAEIVSSAQNDFELAPTPSHQLRYALILATPGHAGTDQFKAQRLLRELTASPAALLPAERALASLEMQKVDVQVSLAAENRRLQALTARNGSDKDRSNAALNKRLQSELEENARLRKELEAAQAKLDAVSDIERSLSERKPSAESRTP
jgi:YfhG lipoprotein